MCIKTNYCFVEDISNEATLPPLEAVSSESKKMFAVDNSENGHRWLRGASVGFFGLVVVIQQGHAVGMHIASSSSGLTCIM